MTTKILIVEDELAIQEMISFVVEQHGFSSICASDFNSGKQSLVEPYPDLILLDWMLPGGNGIQFANELKENEFFRQIPVIILTARSEEADKIKGLESGADDYITKPFSPKELIARIKAVLRRVSPSRLEETINVQGLSIDPVSHRVYTNQNKLDMGPTEFRLLHFLMTHPERVFSREQLLNNVWGTNVYVEDRTVDVHIRRLRKSISLTGHDKFIQTVRGSGYRFSVK